MRPAINRSARYVARRGFTLVELMVSMGLTLFVMTIIVEAFSAGMDTFRGLRALGDIQEQLRGALHLMKDDLVQDHFEGGRRTSDVNFWNEPRREGFFVVRQGSRLGTTKMYVDEGTDLDGVNKSFLARDHVLHFSVRQRGSNRTDVFFDSTANVGFGANDRWNSSGMEPETTYGRTTTQTALTSPWGEVAYYLEQQTGASDSSTPTTILESSAINPAWGPIYLHKLYRTSRLVIPNTDRFPDANGDGTPEPVADTGSNFRFTAWTKPGANLNFVSPNDLARGVRSFNSASPLTDTRSRSLVCSNVVSFQVRILKDGNATNYDDLPLNGGAPETFDSANRPASGYRLMGIQITIRVYDPASGLTRQATLNHDM